VWPGCWCIRALHPGDAGHGGRLAPAGKLIIVIRATIPVLPTVAARIRTPVKLIIRNLREPSLPVGADQERRSGEPSQARNRPPLRDVVTGEDPKIRRGVCSPAGAGLQLPLHLEPRVGMEFPGGTFPIVYQPAVALAQRADAAAQLGVGPELRVAIVVGHVHTAGPIENTAPLGCDKKCYRTLTGTERGLFGSQNCGRTSFT